MSEMTSEARKQHAIYGLYIDPTNILYVGSWLVATLADRLRQHRNGECATTRKMCARANLSPPNLSMRVLMYWEAGSETNPEGETIRRFQNMDQAQWNFPRALTSEENRRGGFNAKGRHHPLRENCARAGRIGIRKLNETWGKTRAAHLHHVRIGAVAKHEDKLRAAKLGGIAGTRKANCARWHNGRSKTRGLCIECTAREI